MKSEQEITEILQDLIAQYKKNNDDFMFAVESMHTTEAVSIIYKNGTAIYDKIILLKDILNLN